MSDLPLESLPAAVLAQMVREAQVTLARAEARIAALEAEIASLRGGGPPKKTAANSSVPPATGWKARRATPPETDRPKRGPKFAHVGVSRPRVPPDQIDGVLPCRPQQCAGCGAALPAVGGTVVARRQVTDLPAVRPVVIEAQRLRVRCRRVRSAAGGNRGAAARGTSCRLRAPGRTLRRPLWRARQRRGARGGGGSAGPGAASARRGDRRRGPGRPGDWLGRDERPGGWRHLVGVGVSDPHRRLSHHSAAAEHRSGADVPGWGGAVLLDERPVEAPTGGAQRQLP